MISVLIPVYNYNAYPLVNEIHKQLINQHIDFEILVYDDASTKNFEAVDLLQQLSNVKYKKHKKNLGRIKNRISLVENAKNNIILFLDADVFPKDRYFIRKLIKEIEKTNADVYFGGIKVANNLTDSSKYLRWKYGKERENIPLNKRKEFPYRSIICGALAIKKDVFYEIANEIKNYKVYGLDIVFTYLLRQKNKKVIHYNNPVIHLGIENSKDFLDKTKQAVETQYFLISNNIISNDYTRIGKIFKKIKKIKFLCIFFYYLLGKICKKFLLSKYASLYILDIYKLCYLCKISKK